MYPAGPLEDAALLARIEARKPKFVMLNIGGGTQERLGHFLRSRLSYRPAIICTGAAVAFYRAGRPGSGVGDGSSWGGCCAASTTRRGLFRGIGRR